MNLIKKWAEHRETIMDPHQFIGVEPFSDRMAAECYDALVHKDADLEERTNQYHLAHAKILSREAIIEGFSDDLKDAQQKISEQEGELAGYALMDAEAEAFLPEVVKQLQARIEELEEAAARATYLLYVQRADLTPAWDKQTDATKQLWLERAALEDTT